MARIKLGAIVTDIKGKVGGHVFQKGRSSIIMRSNPAKIIKARNQIDSGVGRAAPRNKLNFDKAVKYWSQISLADRLSWSALIGVWQFKNSFGDSYNGTGYQIFIAANLNLLVLGKSMISEAPIKKVAEFMNVTLNDYSLSGSWTINILTTPLNKQNMLISSSRNQNVTKNKGSVRLTRIAQIGVLAASTANLKNKYQQTYGGAPLLDSIIFSEIWYTLEEFPMQQFKKSFISNVII